jgi:putative membrane protein
MTTTPQFKRLSPLTPLVRGSLFFVAVLGGTWQMLANGELGPFAILLIAMLLVGFAYGTVSWWLTKYWIEGDELRVDTGVISRQSRQIRIDRLQGIDIVQPLVARFFGLAELKMDVAGGGESEGSLAYLPVGEAQELKEMLLARRDATRHAITPETPLDQLPPPHPERLLARLDVGVLVGSVALSVEAILFGLSGLAIGVVGAVAGSFGAAAGLLPVVGGFAIVVGRRLAGYYNFTVSDTAAGLQVRRGLFELSSQTIALGRVQGVVVSEPLLWRPFGWARLDVSVAGSAGRDTDGKQLSSTVLPVGPREQVLQLARHCLRGLDLTAVPLTGPPERSKWVEPIGRHFLFGGLDERLLVSRSGWFTHKTNAVPHRRVQSLRLSQGPLMRRLRLSTVHVDSPPGPVSVQLPFRDAQEAQELLQKAVLLGRQARKGPAPTPIAETTQ